jgi:hypothetical protein
MKLDRAYRKVFLAVLVLAMGAPSAYACDEDDGRPTIVSNGKVVFSGRPAEDVFDDFPLEDLPLKVRQAGKQGIPLLALFESDANSGSVVLTSCGGRNVSFSLQELREKNDDESQIFLVITKKRVLKLVRARPKKKGEALLLRVTGITIVSESSSD